MKNKSITLIAFVALALTSQISFAQTTELKSNIRMESKEVLQSMIEKSQSLQFYYDNCYGYAIYPKVTKGGLWIGAAGGKGVVYKNHEIVSVSKLTQITLGSQLGGQQYSEVIFFLNQDAFDKFMNKKVKFDGQVSAVAINAGASADLSYSYGVAVFTQSRGGLMYEASLGMQCFANQPIHK